MVSKVRFLIGRAFNRCEFKILTILSYFLISNFVCSFVIAGQCLNYLSGVRKIVIPQSVQRVAISNFSSDVYQFIEGTNALSAKSPIAAVTVGGNDLLLAVHGQTLFEMGPANFSRVHLGLPNSESTKAWVKKVESRLAGYDSDYFEVSGLAKLWSNGRELRDIESIFFARFFNTDLLVRSAESSQYYVRPENQDRVVFISLRIPKSKSQRNLRNSLSGQSMLQIDYTPVTVPVQPENIWFQLPSIGGIPKLVTKGVGVSTNRLVNLAIAKSAVASAETYSSRLMNLGPINIVQPLKDKSDITDGFSALIFQMSFSMFDGQTVIDISSVSPATVSESLALNSEFVKNYLEPVKFAFQLEQIGSEEQILVPDSVFTSNNSVGTQGAIELAFQVLLAQKGAEVLDAIGALKPGQDLYMESLSVDSSNRNLWSNDITGLPIVYHSRAFLFSRSESGKLYLTSFYERKI